MSLNERISTLTLFIILVLFPLSHGVAKNFVWKFTPSEISSLRLWLAPESLLALHHGDRVSSWEDSAQKIAARQVLPASAPTIEKKAIQNHSVAHFNGKNEFLELPERSVLNFVADFSIYFVVQSTSLSTNGDETILSAGESGDKLLFGLWGDRMLFHADFAPLSFLAPPHKSFTRNVWRLLEFHKEVDRVFLIDNGEPVGSGRFAIPAGDIFYPSRTIGCDNISSNCFEGNIAEILIYEKMLSGKDRRSNSCGLAKKYQLKVKGCS